MNKAINNNLKTVPIVIFAFNRPSKLVSLLDSLEKNKEFHDSEVYIFVDKYLEKSDKKNNQKVLEIANKPLNSKSTTVFYNDKNTGLKGNILKGINFIFENNQSAIFLEDDLVVGPYFLNFMNTSLYLYEDNKEVMHISGYNFPTLIGNKSSASFTSLMNCWGWGTWKNRWEGVTNFSINKISKANSKYRRKFNAYGFEKDYESQLIRNERNEIQTWAIFWYQHIYEQQGYCLQPSRSLVINNGIDATGVHKSQTNIYNLKINIKKITNYPEKIRSNFIPKIQIIGFFIYKRLFKNFFNFY
tara:strand:- start:1702 stop:2604 length:903 start_codon:yes stop_codon:yes gene_type:complete